MDVKLKQALFLAGQGMHVFRLQPGKRIPMGGCDSCRTTSPHYDGHHADSCKCLHGGWIERGGINVAASCHGSHAATTDPDTIKRWWTQAPTAGIGINLGKSGLVMIDIDAHQGDAPTAEQWVPGLPAISWGTGVTISSGWDSLAYLAAVRGVQDPWNDERAVRVSTPSGGLHIWYRVPDADQWRNQDGKLAWQVDVKAGPAFAVAPGTEVTGKGSYGPVGPWGIGPGPMPSWLLGECKRAGAMPSGRPSARYNARDALRNRQDAARGVPDAYLAKVTEGVLAEFHAAPAGQRNAALNRAAFRFGKSLVARDESLRDRLVSLLEEAAVAGGTPAIEARATVASGLAGGLRAAGK
jgi:hypothetical protein